MTTSKLTTLGFYCASFTSGTNSIKNYNFKIKINKILKFLLWTTIKNLRSLKKLI